MRRISIQSIGRAAFKAAVFVGILLITPRAISLLAALPKFRSVEQVSHHNVAVILAAEVLPGGIPSAVLRDRILTGIELYNTGKADILVMSGENPEPEIMREFAVEHGVPPGDIILDNYGLRTYDTCFRASQVENLAEVIVVTQLFHLPRTLLLCGSMGLKVVGVPAQPTVFWPHQTLWWQTREALATVLAFSDLYLSPPQVSNLPYGD
jgi:SanA protein